MKVTPLNIVRYWRRLMFPPDRHEYYADRLLLKADLPWEPWLHCGVWIATFLALMFGDTGIVPPVTGVDWVWVSLGLTSPVLGFFSVWELEHGQGKSRYMAIWGRMAADIGLSTAILAYLAARWGEGLLGASSVLSDVILFLSAWFTLVLVHRDIKFLSATEQLASIIHRDEIGEHILRCEERARDVS